MSFDPSPTGYFPGYEASSGGGVVIPFAALESLNANPSNSGDIREVVYSFLEAVTDHYILPTGDGGIGADNRDVNMSITRASSVPNDNQIRKTYTVTLNLDIPALQVSD